MPKIFLAKFELWRHNKNVRSKIIKFYFCVKNKTFHIDLSNFVTFLGGMALFASSANPGSQFIGGDSRSMDDTMDQVQKSIDYYD